MGLTRNCLTSPFSQWVSLQSIFLSLQSIRSLLSRQRRSTCMVATRRRHHVNLRSFTPSSRWLCSSLHSTIMTYLYRQVISLRSAISRSTRTIATEDNDLQSSTCMLHTAFMNSDGGGGAHFKIEETSHQAMCFSVYQTHISSTPMGGSSWGEVAMNERKGSWMNEAMLLILVENSEQEGKMKSSCQRFFSIHKFCDVKL